MRIVPQSERDRMNKEWEKKRPQMFKEAMDKIIQNREQKQDTKKKIQSPKQTDSTGSVD